MNTDTLFFAYYLKYALIYMNDNVMKNVSNFQIPKFQPHGVAQYLPNFGEFQPGVYEKVAFKKSV